MATKLRALYQRRKGRDLFDMWWALSHTEMDLTKLVDIFKKYNEFNKENITRALFEESLFHKSTSEDFRQDISYLLTPESKWDFDTAYRTVMSIIPEHLNGEAWAGIER